MKRSQIKRRPLADSVIANLEGEAKEYRELDGNGLYLRVKPDGGKSWQLRYKSPTTGKWSWLGLGGYPERSGGNARELAAKWRKSISDGHDPIEDRKAQKDASDAARVHLFRNIAYEWLEFKKSKGLAHGTLRQVELYLEKDILPALGHKTVDEITRADCSALQDQLSDRGAHDVADKVRAWLNQIFGRAIGRGITENDPASRLSDVVKPSPPVKHYPHLVESQLPDFLQALKQSTSRTPQIIATWLCIWTASRPGMVRGAEWHEFDIEKRIWTVPAEKMKTRRDHVSPLSNQAIAALTNLQRMTGSGRYLFPGIGKSPVISENTINKVLANIGYKRLMVGHGARHTASTLLREHGWHKQHVEAQLAHKEEGIAGVYNKAQYLDQRRAMMQWYADYLDKLADGMTEKDKKAFDQRVNQTGAAQ